jgi:hypothetical protein
VEGGTESGNWHALVSGKDVGGNILPDGTAADFSLTGFLGTAAAGPNGTTSVTVDISAGDESLTADGTINAAKDALTGSYSKRFPGLTDQSSDGTFAGAGARGRERRSREPSAVSCQPLAVGRWPLAVRGQATLPAGGKEGRAARIR